MARKRETPRIHTVTVAYNGNADAFDTFIKSMITEYLNSDRDSLHRIDTEDFIDKVELSEESA